MFINTGSLFTYHLRIRENCSKSMEERCCQDLFKDFLRWVVCYCTRVCTHTHTHKYMNRNSSFRLTFSIYSELQIKKYWECASPQSLRIIESKGWKTSRHVLKGISWFKTLFKDLLASWTSYCKHTQFIWPFIATDYTTHSTTLTSFS